MADIPDLLDKYKSALGNTAEMSIVWTEDFGLPYLDATQKVTAEMVLANCTQKTMLSRAEKTYIGMDVGGSKKGCHCVIIKPHPVKMFEIVWLGVIQPEALKVQAKLYDAKKSGIDAAPEDHLARGLQTEIKNLWRVRYSDSQKTGYKWLDEEKEVQVNRTSSLDAMFSLLRKGEILLPRRSPDVEEFAKHCAALTKTLETDPDTGKKEYYYKLTGKAADYAHALSYALIQCYDGTRRIGGVSLGYKVPDNIRGIMTE
jgi:hypothetical protein